MVQNLQYYHPHPNAPLFRPSKFHIWLLMLNSDKNYLQFYEKEHHRISNPILSTKYRLLQNTLSPNIMNRYYWFCYIQYYIHTEYANQDNGFQYIRVIYHLYILPLSLHEITVMMKAELRVYQSGLRHLP